MAGSGGDDTQGFGVPGVFAQYPTLLTHPEIGAVRTSGPHPTDTRTGVQNQPAWGVLNHCVWSAGPDLSARYLAEKYVVSWLPVSRHWPVGRLSEPDVLDWHPVALVVSLVLPPVCGDLRSHVLDDGRYVQVGQCQYDK